MILYTRYSDSTIEFNGISYDIKDHTLDIPDKIGGVLIRKHPAWFFVEKPEWLLEYEVELKKSKRRKPKVDIEATSITEENN